MSNNAFEQAKREYLDKQSKGNKNPFLIFVVAIILIVVGVFASNDNQDFIKNAKITKGITYYERDRLKSSSESDYYNIYVKYNVNGKEYYEYLKSEQLGGIANIGQKSGKEITIYYNPDNPTEIKDKSSNIICIFIMGFGGIILLSVVGDFIYRKVKDLKMDDSTPNYVTAEKVVNFWKEVDNKTELFEKTSTIEKIASNSKKIIGGIVCVLIIGFGILCVVKDNEFSDNSMSIVATVSRIEKTEKRDFDNNRYIDTEVYVKYNVDGKQYEEKIDINANDLTQGSRVNIYYNVNNPKEIKNSNEIKYTGYIIIAAGVIFLIGCLLFPTNIAYIKI